MRNELAGIPTTGSRQQCFHVLEPCPLSIQCCRACLLSRPLVNCADVQDDRQTAQKSTPQQPAQQLHITTHTTQTTQTGHATAIATMASSYNRCFGCSKTSSEALLRCSRCKCVYFCSVDCQKAANKEHRSFCKSMAKEPSPQCFLVDGMSPCGADDFHTEKVKKELVSRGVPYVHIDVYKGSRLPEQVSCALSELESLTSCLIFGWGSGDEEMAGDFGSSTQLAAAMKAFVRQRGNLLLVHGERINTTCHSWPENWFALPWMSSSYFRTDFPRNEQHWSKGWYHGNKHAPRKYNVKACMLSGVADGDSLYRTDNDSRTYSLVPHMAGQGTEPNETAFALARVGDAGGMVGYYGDVNAEDSTMSAVGIIIERAAAASSA
mmetsp:Transcript_3472/g.9932  ORF Transcript_3472/g.9932 Transcript_3472/m.9932 type:complete len:379 (+) Transcript_3472:1667-2803(+)